jgi:hypothetical protein
MHNNKTIKQAAVSEIGRNEAFEEYHTTRLFTQSVTYTYCIINKSACCDNHCPSIIGNSATTLPKYNNETIE